MIMTTATTSIDHQNRSTTTTTTTAAASPTNVMNRNLNNSKNENDEWTVVSRKMTHNKKKRSTATGKNKNNKQMQLMAKTKMAQTLHHCDHDHDHDHDHRVRASSDSSKETNRNEVETETETEIDTSSIQLLAKSVEECMQDLESFARKNHHRSNSHSNSSVTFDFHTLLHSLHEAANGTGWLDDLDCLGGLEHEEEKKHQWRRQGQRQRGQRTINEIICYGIGNFDTMKRGFSFERGRKRRGRGLKQSYSTSFSSPVIQLACILLIRQYLAMDIGINVNMDISMDVNVDMDAIHSDDDKRKQFQECTPATDDENTLKNISTTIDSDGNNNDDDDNTDEDVKYKTASLSKDRNKNINKNNDSTPTSTSTSTLKPNNYKRQQELVPILYFEPFMKPIEKRVLEEIFHVVILETNEQGKRCIINEEQTKTNTNVKTKSTPIRSERTVTTLFYMPHCPMRLYSNVLWANWDANLLLSGRIIILGNSFQAYDDRIISFEQRNDGTNCIFPLLPLVEEIPVLMTPSSAANRWKREQPKDVDGGVNHNNNIQIARSSNASLAWHELEMAFNDCAIISFSMSKVHNSGAGGKGELTANIASKFDWPMRPMEYFIMSGIDSEVI